MTRVNWMVKLWWLTGNTHYNRVNNHSEALAYIKHIKLNPAVAKYELIKETTTTKVTRKGKFDHDTSSSD